MTILAVSHCVLTKLLEILNKLYSKYQAVPICFLSKKQLSYLKPLLNELLGKQELKLANVEKKTEIVLGVSK